MAIRTWSMVLGLASLPFSTACATTDLMDGLLALDCEPADGVTVCTADNGRPPATRLTAVVVRAAATDYAADVVPVDRVADIETLFAETCSQAPASIIGGYYGERDDRTPYALGLIVSEGEQAAPWTPWTVGGAIVVDAAGDTAIRYWREMEGLAPVEALQSKPILVNANANDGIVSGWDRANRVAFGLTDGGDLVLIGIVTEAGSGVLRAPTLKEFADYIAAIRFADGAVVERAINLDGGPSANLYVRSAGALYGSTAGRYVPAILCLGVR